MAHTSNVRIRYAGNVRFRVYQKQVDYLDRRRGDQSFVVVVLHLMYLYFSLETSSPYGKSNSIPAATSRRNRDLEL